MNKEEILLELQKRNVDINSSMGSSDSILQELKLRGLEQTNDGNFLPTPNQQKIDQGSYGNIIDDTEIPAENTITKPINDYLTSKEFGRLALEISGGVAGAMFPPLGVARAAMLVRPALQQTAKAMMGAGLGEAIGAGISQSFDPSFNSQDDFVTIAKDVSKDLLRAGATGVAGEGVGQIIGKGITKVLSRNKKLLQGAEEAVKTIEEQKIKILANPKSYSQEVNDAVKVGQLTPGLLQKGQTIDILEGISEASLFGGGALRYAKEGANTIAQTGLDDFVKLYKVKAGDGSLGNLFQKTLTEDVEAFKSMANSKYSALDKALSSEKFANNFQVDLTDLKAWAGNELNNLGLKGQSTKLKSFLSDILAENNYTTFKRANILRGDLLESSRAFTTETLGKKKGRLSAIASKKITDAMENSPIPSSTKGLLNEANKHYKEGAEVFNDTLFKKIIDNDPDLVYKSIVAAGDRPTLIKKTFEILEKRIKDVGERKLLKNKIRGEFLDDILTKSQVSNDQFGVEIDATKLFANFTKKEESFKVMFSNKEISNFKKFQNALKFAQGKKSKTGGLPGPMMIQMKQSGAIVQLAGASAATGGGFGGVGAAILIGPAIIAQAFTTPKIIKALTLGIKYQDNPSLARRYFLQSMFYMAQENLISDDEYEKIKNDVKDMKN